MNKKTTISLRAFFLLLVFFLNTGIGFACAVQTGLFSDSHRDMHNMHGMHHDHKKPAHQCCGDGMIRFEQLDKAKAYQEDVLHMPAFTLSYPVLYLAGLSEGYHTSLRTYVVLRQNPPPTDIRVSIQSFQI